MSGPEIGGRSKIPQALHGPIFVGDEFVAKVHSARLEGLVFHEVWRSADETAVG